MKALFAHTLPLWPVDEEGRCSCGQPDCRRPGKHPARNAPDGGGYAVITGADAGIFVLDIDVKGGKDGYAELARFGDPPRTLTVRTGSGGAHFYFKHPGFPVRNIKPADGIDIKGDKDRDDGLVYVVGPGSPGYVRTEDPCVVTPADPYEVVDDSEIADAPEWLLSWLRIGKTREEGFPPTPISEEHQDWAWRLELAKEACLTLPPSRGDGEGGTKLLEVCLRLVRSLELPLETAHSLVVEHFNPRCTTADGASWPWSDEEIAHKLEDARDRSNRPCGIAPKEWLDFVEEHGKPPAMRNMHGSQDTRDANAGPTEGQAADGYGYCVGQLSSHPEAKKVPFNDLVNIFARGEDWAGCWRYDDFSDAIVCVDPPIRLDAEGKGLSAGDVSDIRALLEHRGVLAAEKEITAALLSAARMKRFHPVRDYLDTLAPGNPAIFHGLAKVVFGTDEPLADEFLRKFMVSAVRRILTPGCQVDTVLVLYGPKQGEGKTTLVEALFDPWCRRGLPSDLANRDASHALLGYWGIELGELAALLRTEKNAAKDFISWRGDVYRQFGNGQRVKRPRECVFIGTTNDDDFLRDATGNRRFWVIVIDGGYRIPLAWVREHRDEIWAAALTLAKDASFRHWFTREEEEQVAKTREPFLERDAWHDKIEDFCKGKEFVKVADIYTTALGGELKEFDRKKMLRITDTLKRLGCKSGQRPHREDPDRTKVWFVPGGVREAKLSAAEVARRNAEAAMAKLRS